MFVADHDSKVLAIDASFLAIKKECTNFTFSQMNWQDPNLFIIILVFTTLFFFHSEINASLYPVYEDGLINATLIPLEEWTNMVV